MAARILIADDVSNNRIVLKSHLCAAAFTVVSVSDFDLLLAQVRSDPPDLIILPDVLSNQSGRAICARLRKLAQTRHVPIILLADHSAKTTRLDAFQAGADAVLARHPEIAVLRARIRSLLRRAASDSELQHATQSENLLGFGELAPPGFAMPGQIALIAESLAQGLNWRNGLTALMRDRIAVIEASQALKELSQGPVPDAVVIADTPSNPAATTEIITDLRSRSETLRTALLVVQNAPNGHRQIAALDMGVDDVLEHGFEASELSLLLRRELARKSRNDSCRKALRDGLRLAATDPLTGIYNRRYALGQLQSISESGEPFSVMVIDIDRFKSINDRHGHKIGDFVLQVLSARMRDCLRNGDFLARIGGEEFLAVIRGCDADSAKIAAERLRLSVADLPVELTETEDEIDVTVSIGLVVSQHLEPGLDPAVLIDRADRGLYKAKADGRNQVTVFQTAA